MSTYDDLKTLINTNVATNGTNSITASDIREVVSGIIGSMSQSENIKNYGAIGDGSTHTLSEKYLTLAAAQVDYPFATSLANEIDRCALEKALRTGNSVYIPEGTYIIDSLSLSNMNIVLDMDRNALLKTNTDLTTMILLTNCTTNINNIYLDGNSRASIGVKIYQGTVRISNIELSNIGSTISVPTSWTAGILLQSATTITLGNIKCTGFSALGDGVGGNDIGACIGILFLSCGRYTIDTFYMDGITAEELDFFQVNTGNEGGLVSNLIARYNGNVRRCVKIQSGRNVIKSIDIKKADDFVAASGSTEAGIKNWNCVDVTTPDNVEYNTTLDVLSGYIDASGFQAGFCASSGAGCARLHHGVILKGPVLNVIRTHEFAGPQNQPAVGFYTNAAATGSGVDGVVFVNFGTAISLTGSNQYVRNCTIIDPVGIIGTVGYVTNAPTYNLVFSNNTIITKTSGYLPGTTYYDCLHVYNVQNAQINYNTFVQSGNTTNHPTFIRFGTSTATGVALGNSGPSTMVITDKGSSVVKTGLDNGVSNGVYSFAVSDEDTNLVVGTSKMTFRFPFSVNIKNVTASVNTAPTGANLILNIKKNGTSIFSTLLSIDATEKTSTTAATPAVLSTTTITADDEITVDITQVGSTAPGAGLKINLFYTN